MGQVEGNLGRSPMMCVQLVGGGKHRLNCDLWDYGITLIAGV